MSRSVTLFAALAFCSSASLAQTIAVSGNGTFNRAIIGNNLSTEESFLSLSIPHSFDFSFAFPPVHS